MQEHPIPQDITGYRFHIIGSMTLKQFGEIFLGVIIAVIFYSTNLSGVIKWPLILFSVGLGAAAAFVPIEERPLDHWIITFIKVIYKPTKFFWKREAKIPEAFLFESTETIVQEPEMDFTPAKRQRIKEYLGSIPEDSSFSTDFSPEELARMQKILSSFETTKVTVSKSTVLKPVKIKPNLDIRIRSLREPQESESHYHSNIKSDVFEKRISKPNNNKRKNTLSSDQVAQDIRIPKQEIIKLESKENEQEKNKDIKFSSDFSKKAFVENTNLKNGTIQDAKNVTFNSSLPFPIKPTKPNKLVGMVLSQNGDILANSIVEVQTMDGKIERAVKTNSLGQFFITTPLKIGEYNVVVEKDDYIFQALHIKINNEIIQPIEIRSKN